MTDPAATITDPNGAIRHFVLTDDGGPSDGRWGDGAYGTAAFGTDVPGTYAIHLVADGTNDKVWILDRASGKTLGSFGRNGTYAGQFHWINAIVMDSKGNIYTGEVEENKRIQKFAPVMAGRR